MATERKVRDAVVEMRPEGGAWSLYVDGRRTVDRESYTVVDQIKYAFEHPRALWGTETSEAAGAIRAHCERS
jgi:hypothetical protein